MEEMVHAGWRMASGQKYLRKWIGNTYTVFYYFLILLLSYTISYRPSRYGVTRSLTASAQAS